MLKLESKVKRKRIKLIGKFLLSAMEYFVWLKSPVRWDHQSGIDIDIYIIRVIRRDHSQPDCLSVSFMYTKDQIVLDVPSSIAMISDREWLRIHLGRTNTQYILFSLLKSICKKHGVKVYACVGRQRIRGSFSIQIDIRADLIDAYISAVQEVLYQNDTFHSLRQDVLSYLVRSPLVLQESIGAVKSYLRQLIDL
uniref:Uncharacterized protein n=1 Tax=Cucumis melo TaxID=3656 RepID=A0A9I9ELJ1_CUCME